MDYQAFLLMMRNFKTKVMDFYNAVTNLDKIAAQTQKVPELEAQRLKLLDLSSVIRSTVDDLTGSIDSTIGWIQSTLGFGDKEETVGNLEAFPILGIAVVAAAVTAITKWLTDYASFMQRFDATEKLIARGTPPAQAYNLAAGLAGPSMTKEIMKGLIPLAVIAGVAWFLPQYMPKLKLFGR